MYRPGRIRSERWSQVASLCRDEPRTIPAIARAMGVQAGSLRSLVASMRQHQLLEEATSDARGQAFRLTQRGRAELRKHDRQFSRQKPLQRGERLVFVIDEGRGTGATVLAQIAIDTQVHWAARLDGSIRWILSFGAGEAAPAERAARALVAAGARAIVCRADLLVDGNGFADLAAELLRDERPVISRT